MDMIRNNRNRDSTLDILKINSEARLVMYRMASDRVKDAEVMTVRYKTYVMPKKRDVYIGKEENM